MTAVAAGALHAHVALELALRVHHGHTFDFTRVHVTFAAVADSVAGAACYAFSSVIQHRTATEAPPHLSLRPSLLIELAKKPWWLFGILSDFGGFAFMFFALRSGSLALVTPLFVIGVVFSVIGAAYMQRRRPEVSEWVESILVFVGLAAFLIAAQPGRGHPRTSAGNWILLFVIAAVVVGGAVLAAQLWRAHRALLLGVGAGILYGVISAITEHTAFVFNRGVLHALGTWAPYALVIVGALGLLLNQSAFQAGSISLSLPIMTVLEPVTAILIGQVLFNEHIASGTVPTIGEILGLVITAGGVFALARHATEIEASDPANT